MGIKKTANPYLLILLKKAAEFRESKRFLQKNGECETTEANSLAT